MKQVLITGGAGFIGANLAQYYLKKGCKVVLFDNFSRRGCMSNLSWLKSHAEAQNLAVLPGDLRRPDGLLQEAVEASDAVFHFAAQVAVTNSVVEPRHDFEVNAQGTFNVLELVRSSQGKKPALFYSSTNKVYGNLRQMKIAEGPQSFYSQDLPNGIAEDCPLDFHSPYGCSKGAADQYVLDYARMYGMQTVVFRQSCIYGRRQFGVEDQGWVAWFVIAAVLGRPLTIFGNGKQVRDVLFVEDLVDAFDRAWSNIDRAQGRAYNIGGGPANAISLSMLLDYLKKEVNPALDVQYAPWRPGDQPVYISNIAKAQKQLGWRPRISWRSGVQSLVEWVADNKDMIEDHLSFEQGTPRLDIRD